MKKTINLDEIYNLEFEKVKNELKQYSIEKLQIKNGKKLFVKKRDLQMEIVSRIEAFDRLRTSETSFHDDKYTQELFSVFKNNIDGYEELPITQFVEEYLNKIKLQFKETQHSLPKNIKLNEKDTVILIAKRFSTRLFLDNLDLIDDFETIEKMIDLINSDEPIKIKKEEFEVNKYNSEQARNFEKEFTTSRQVLAIQYLFKHASIREESYKNSELANFIRFLTSKELGNEKITNTSIYKKIRNPFKDKENEKIADLKYIRSYFQRLNLYEIVNIINDEIKS